MIDHNQGQSIPPQARIPNRDERHDTVLSESPAPDAAPQPQPLARFYMTSDLRAATGLTRSHLDFYLRESIIVPTARTESGYLLFDETELATLRQVIAWRQEGIGIRDIRDRLARTGSEPALGAGESGRRPND